MSNFLKNISVQFLLVLGLTFTLAACGIPGPTPEDTTAPTTTASPAGGTYTSVQSVTLTCTDDKSGCASTYYTTDGTEPTTGSPVYSTPISISGDTTLKFFSIDNAGNSESVKTETYVITGTTYTVGGTVSGLSGTVVLQNNGGDDLSISADASFTFATPLADGSTYAVTVSTQPSGQACTVSNGNSTISGADVTNVEVTCTSTGTLSAPQNVQATAGDTQITISWDTVDGATSYNLYWNNTGGVTTSDSLISDVSSPYDHTGLINGTTYYYVVTATNAVGESSPSSEVSATPATTVTEGYWRFEEGTAGVIASGAESIIDSSISLNHGTPAGSPTYSSEVPVSTIPNIGANNTLSMVINGSNNDKVSFSSTFLFHNPGDATLEFWLNYNPASHQSLFWTRSDSTDKNRFNIYVNGNGTFGFDYRTPGGTRHALLGGSSSGYTIPTNT